MTERQLQFRVGLFVVTALVVATALMFTFGEMRRLFQKSYTLAVRFDDAPGVQELTPVRKNGITIGQVGSVAFDEKRGGVTVTIEVNEQYRLRRDSQARLTQSLLGDASIEFTPGKSPHYYKPGDVLVGEPAVDVMKIVERLEETMGKTMESFEATSAEWRKVGENVNNLVDTNRGNIETVVERAAESLHQFTITLNNANQIVGNPENQRNIERAVAALPTMVEETRDAIAAVKMAVGRADENLENLSHVTRPLALRSHKIVMSLDSSVVKLDKLMSELNQFAQMANAEDGSLKKFVADPELYDNLNHTAELMSVMLRNLEPAMRDLRVFADKIARHPEKIGLGGALKSSSGLK